MNTKKITYYGLLTSIGIILPFIFHYLLPFSYSKNTLGQWLLPIHYGGLFAGLFFGPIAGVLVGGLTPLLSFTITGMPNAPMVWFIAVEVALYGLIVGLLNKRFKLNIYFSMIIAMLIGRTALYLQALYIGKHILGKAILVKLAVDFITVGVVGEVLQLIIIPIVVTRIRKVRNFDI